MSKNYYVSLDVKVYKPTELTASVLQDWFTKFKIKDELKVTACVVMECDDGRARENTETEGEAKS